MPFLFPTSFLQLHRVHSLFLLNVLRFRLLHCSLPSDREYTQFLFISTRIAAGPASLTEVPPFSHRSAGTALSARVCVWILLSVPTTSPSRRFPSLLPPRPPAIGESAPPPGAPRSRLQSSPRPPASPRRTIAMACTPPALTSTPTPHPKPFSLSQSDKTPYCSPHLKRQNI